MDTMAHSFVRRSGLIAFALLTLWGGRPSVGLAKPARVVTASALAEDGQLSGADIRRALDRCPSGCIVELMAGTYEDVAIEILGSTPAPSEIRGQGVGVTILRAHVPSRRPVLWLQGSSPAPILRNFTIDGRKAEQNDSARRSIGVLVSNPSLRNARAGRIEQLEVRGLLDAGIRIRDGTGWVVTNSLIEEIGCHTELPCPALRGPAIDPYITGRKRAGYGIQLIGAGARGARVTNNRVRGATKIGIEAYTNRNDEVDPASLISDVQILGNEVSRTLAGGIVVNGGRDVLVEGNTVTRTGGSGVKGNGGTGISCGGESFDLTIKGNRIANTMGAGIRLDCSGDRLRVESNHVGKSCVGRLGTFAAINVLGRGGRSSGLQLVDNRVEAESDCDFGLFVGRYRDVEIRAGRVMNRHRAGLVLRDVERVRVDGIQIGGSPERGIVVRGATDDVHIAANVIVAPGISPDVDVESGRNVRYDRP